MAKLTPKQFVAAYYPFAKQTEDATGIDARFTLAQAALESEWGAKVPGNMFFGVKVSKNTPEDKRQLLTTFEDFADDKQGYRFPEVISITPKSNGRYRYVVKDWFRKYATPEESFTDHANVLLNNKNFAHAVSFRHDPFAFADAIQSGKRKYATGDNYATVLKDVIRTIERAMK